MNARLHADKQAETLIRSSLRCPHTGELVLWSQCLPRFTCCFCTVNQQEACSVPSGEIGGLWWMEGSGDGWKVAGTVLGGKHGSDIPLG